MHVRQGLRRGWLVLLKGRSAATIATASHYLAWEYEASNAHPISALFERDRKTGKLRELAASVLPQFGLASTSTHVVYAIAGAPGAELVAIRHDGSERVVLSRSLAAPVDSRGSMVAWAEQPGSYQRVVVRNMDTGRVWVAARMPRCDRDKCYRIDAVTLADDGVVFSRGAIGTQPSLIVRRKFGDAKPSTVSVENDPQPDLTPSSAGALYFWLQHGWMRWDFGARRPHPAGVGGVQSWIIGYQHGRLLLSTGSRCRPRLIVRAVGKPPQAVRAPTTTPASPKDFGPLCRLISDTTWQGRGLIVAWTIIPRISLNAHTDAGLVGLITETAVS